MSTSATESGHSPLKALAQWWRDMTAPPLATAVGESEAGKIASDVGLTVAELEQVRHLGADAADPMVERLASVGLDPEEVATFEPAVFHDLQRVCAFCDSKKQCINELKHHPDATEWRSYCPNMPTFKALQATAHR